MKFSELLCIADYNAFMGGMDKLDWLVNRPRIKIGRKKWHILLFTNLINIIVVSAHVLFCLVYDPISLLDFRRQIVRIM